MKKNLIKTGAIAAAIILAASCSSGNGDGNLISVNFNRVDKGPVTNISELVGEPEFIALDSRVEAFSTGFTYAFSDHYICIGASMRGPAKLYDRATGKFLCDVGTIGRGPGEYLNTYGAPRIDEEDGTIWLLPWQTKTLLGFDITTGKFKKEVPLKYGVPKGQFQVDCGLKSRHSNSRRPAVQGPGSDDCMAAGHAGQFNLGNTVRSSVHHPRLQQ